MATAKAKARWAFTTRFRRSVFGWKGSRLAIARIQDALSELRAAARNDPVAAAQGAVLFLERLSPALQQVDGSSGALGHACAAAVEELARLIAGALVDDAERARWLDRLFDAMQDDDPPYIESLGGLWGDLCSNGDLARAWADRLLPEVRRVQVARGSGSHAFFQGTTACYSAMFKAGRHDGLLDLLSQNPWPLWDDIVWGARVFVQRGHVDAALDYLEARGAAARHPHAFARFAEDALLQAGRRNEAFTRYAMLSNQSNSNLSTFRNLTKKYPEVAPRALLDRLVEASGSEPGKWFATAKTLKVLDLASSLAWASPCDPKTLIRAARDHRVTQPEFAMQSALAALHWMSMGHGYELTGLDVMTAHGLAIDCASLANQTDLAMATLAKVLEPDRPQSAWMCRSLGLASDTTRQRRH